MFGGGGGGEEGGRKVTIRLLVPVRDWHCLLCLTWKPASCQPDVICLRLILSEGSDLLSALTYSLSLHLLTHRLYRLSQVKTTCDGLTIME